ncbi:uncharacterized protein LOC112494210 [Cephus cinctus]|uniref:Uncharacterized protein LOC112494210 n=1 Tax=Cephus cinctus TaxID=211228 RepID=A0AAJ7W0B9_CEPCN|nr:uncharacterized protein LOC112494210 [Cephus cinctus]
MQDPLAIVPRGPRNTYKYTSEADNYEKWLSLPRSLMFGNVNGFLLAALQYRKYKVIESNYAREVDAFVSAMVGRPVSIAQEKTAKIRRARKKGVVNQRKSL